MPKYRRIYDAIALVPLFNSVVWAGLPGYNGNTIIGVYVGISSVPRAYTRLYREMQDEIRQQRRTHYSKPENSNAEQFDLPRPINRSRPGEDLSPLSLLHMQQTIGNRRVSQIVARKQGDKKKKNAVGKFFKKLFYSKKNKNTALNLEDITSDSKSIPEISELPPEFSQNFKAHKSNDDVEDDLIDGDNALSSINDNTSDDGYDDAESSGDSDDFDALSSIDDTGDDQDLLFSREGDDDDQKSLGEIPFPEDVNGDDSVGDTVSDEDTLDSDLERSDRSDLSKWELSFSEPESKGGDKDSKSSNRSSAKGGDEDSESSSGSSNSSNKNVEESSESSSSSPNSGSGEFYTLGDESDKAKKRRAQLEKEWRKKKENRKAGPLDQVIENRMKQLGPVDRKAYFQKAFNQFQAQKEGIKESPERSINMANKYAYHYILPKLTTINRYEGLGSFYHHQEFTNRRDDKPEKVGKSLRLAKTAKTKFKTKAMEKDYIDREKAFNDLRFRQEHGPRNQWGGSGENYGTKYINSTTELNSYELKLVKNKKTKEQVFYWRGKQLDTNQFTRGLVSGTTVVGTAIFVMTESGRIFIADEGMEMTLGMDASTNTYDWMFKHSTFLQGEPVAAAGEMVFENGVLTYISDESGHYKPTAEHMVQVLKLLQKHGLKLEGVKFKLHSGLYDAQKYLAGEYGKKSKDDETSTSTSKDDETSTSTSNKDESSTSGGSESDQKEQVKKEIKDAFLAMKIKELSFEDYLKEYEMRYPPEVVLEVKKELQEAED